MGDFLEDGYFTACQAELVREGVRALLVEIRPDAVALVDAFNHSCVIAVVSVVVAAWLWWRFSGCSGTRQLKSAAALLARCPRLRRSDFRSPFYKFNNLQSSPLPPPTRHPPGI